MKPVRIKDLSKEFTTLRRGKVTALSELNLDIEEGSFFVLLGPSGCGKSTLLNLIAGLEEPTTGEIWIGDKLAASAQKRISLPPRQRDIAMVFQSYALYPHMTVAENIGFPLRIAGINKAEIARRIEKAAETIGLLSMLEAKPAELSGGQRQRVALGRAIVREPNLLLLDEPLSNLDALLRVNMRAELKDIQRRLGITTIYVTHDQSEALSMGDTVAVLNNGTLQQAGKPLQIYDDPANLFMARFIGDPPANILSEKQIARISDSIQKKFPVDPLSVTAAVRPEHIRLAHSGNGTVDGIVKMISTPGGESLIYIEFEDRRIIAKSHRNEDIKENDIVGMLIDTEKMLLFDRKSGLRIRDADY